MSNINRVLEQLRKLKRTGKNSWLACCPAHEDRSPSFAVKLIDDGRILMHCFGGCSTDEIIGAMGLEFSDIMPENEGFHKKSPEKRRFNAMDVLHAVRDDLQLSLIIAKDTQAGIVLDSEQSLVLARLIGRVTTAIRLAGSD